MIDRKKIVFLKLQGKSLAEIGRIFGVSKQRIFAIYTDYNKKYYKTEGYLAYKRHYKGHSKPYKPCKYCQKEEWASMTP